MAAQATSFVTYESSGPCPTCGVEVFMPAWLVKHRREDKATFYCFNGHSQSFRESENDRLKREIAEKQRQLDSANARATVAENSARAHKGKVTEIQNRIANGVCPCCKRSFQNLRRHMATKHPEVKP